VEMVEEARDGLREPAAVVGALLENDTLVPVTGRLSAGPCGRH